MNNTFLKAVGLAGALTMVAAQGHAQINNSTSLTIGISTSGTSGSFVPSSGGSGNSDNGGSGRGSVSPAVIARLNHELGPDGAGILDPVTGQTILGQETYALSDLLNDLELPPRSPGASGGESLRPRLREPPGGAIVADLSYTVKLGKSPARR